MAAPLLDLSPVALSSHDPSGAVLPRGIATDNQIFNTYTPFEEVHEDQVIITEHPVDKGAVMSDHIFMRPPTVRLSLGWSNADIAASGPSYARDIYSNLLAMKNDRRKLAVVWTGKRLYKNMFMLNMMVRTDFKTEYALVADVEFKQLLLVNTQSKSGGFNTVRSTTSGADPNTTIAPGIPTSDGGGAAVAGGFRLDSFATGDTLSTGNGTTTIPSSAFEGSPIGTTNTDGGGAFPVVPFGM